MVRVAPPGRRSYRSPVRAWWGLAVAVLVVTAAGAIDPAGTPAGRAALAACEAARGTGDVAALDRAVAEAEAAAGAAPDDPIAHFALFCSLGERMRARGASLRSLLELRRLRSEVDRTIELAPDFPDALVGKANLLLDAPGLLGGDPREAERLLRRALEIDPGYLGARRDLARVLARLGDVAGARREAARALADAKRHGDADDVAAARALRSSLGH
jgi:tetratricopeptide (TPR) repeat protein